MFTVTVGGFVPTGGGRRPGLGSKERHGIARAPCLGWPTPAGRQARQRRGRDIIGTSVAPMPKERPHPPRQRHVPSNQEATERQQAKVRILQSASRCRFGSRRGDANADLALTLAHVVD